jgi:hypothetical protein
MDKIYIYGHLGLGDHIICNAIYRELINKEFIYTLFIKHHNIETVRFMLRDIPNIEFFGVNDDEEVVKFIRKETPKIIVIGFNNITSMENFDEQFYLQHNIEFRKRWDNFVCLRDIESEKRLFNKFNVKEGEYVFIHDDESRGFKIDTSHVINKSLPVIRPVLGLTKNSFDYCYLMQNSIESHFIDSSFRLIFDSLKLRNTNLYFHINLSGGINRGYKPKSILDFNII